MTITSAYNHEQQKIEICIMYNALALDLKFQMFRSCCCLSFGRKMQQRVLPFFREQRWQETAQLRNVWNFKSSPSALYTISYFSFVVFQLLENIKIREFVHGRRRRMLIWLANSLGYLIGVCLYMINNNTTQFHPKSMVLLSVLSRWL